MSVRLRGFRVAAGVVGLLAFVLAPIPAWADAAGDIKTLQEAFIAAFRAKDLDAIMKFYAADEKLLVFDVVPPRQFVGAAAYREDWKEFLDTIERLNGLVQE